MSKKRYKRTNESLPSQTQRTRDAKGIARRANPRPPGFRVHSLLEIEDLRRYQHDSYRAFESERPRGPQDARKSYHDIFGAVTEPRKQQPSQVRTDLRYLPGQLHYRFFDPRTTIVCIRRRSRRRVLFALRKVGKGRGYRFRRPRWSAHSYIRCK